MQIIVLGMHRSGVSLVARIINMMGAYIGPADRLIPPDSDNPTGLWERQDVTHLNEDILRAGGGSWWNVLDFSWDRIGRTDRDVFVGRIRAILAEMDSTRHWIINDPRMCITFPLWRDSLPSQVFVYVHRHPLAIARSLQHRNQIPVSAGIGIWELYSLHALGTSNAPPRVLVRHGDILDTPNATTRLYEELSSCGVQDLSIPTEEQLTRYIDPTLSHFPDACTAASEYLNDTQRRLADCIASGRLPNPNRLPSAGGIEAQREYIDARGMARERHATQSPHRERSEPDLQNKLLILQHRLNIATQHADTELSQQRRSYEQKIKTLQNELELSRHEHESEMVAFRKHHEYQLNALKHALSIERQNQEEKVRNLKYFLTELDRNLSDIFQSWRWKLGHSAVSVIERILRRSSANLAKDHVLHLLHEFRALDTKPESINELLVHDGVITRSITREQFVDHRLHELRTFLSSGDRLRLPITDEPNVSVLLVLYNRAELTFWCLQSLIQEPDVSYEVIIVDNHSTDDTHDLLYRIEGAQIIRNTTNRGFVSAANQAAERATGKNILFLNNDAKLIPGALMSATTTLETLQDVGVVGGKLLSLDGRIQECGSIIWSDGSCQGYGRGESPTLPEFMFRRDVDYCSGAFLLTPRHLFTELGGFDERFAPAYYEETDYCVKVREAGLRVVFEPKANIVHFEFASSLGRSRAIQLQERNQRIFCEKHSNQLKSHYSPESGDILKARFSAGRHVHVLYIDDRVPHISLGSGFPRANRTVATLVNLGYKVTVYPLNFPHEDDWSTAYVDIPADVEIMLGCGRGQLRNFLKDRTEYYDVIMVSRPHNMLFFKQVVQSRPYAIGNSKVVYDAEAIVAMRDMALNQLKGRPAGKAELNKKVGKEVSLAENADLIFTVTETERNTFLQERVNGQIRVLGHTIERRPTPRPFSQRSHILFVGNLDEAHAPNMDSLKWFVDQILPRVQVQLGDVRLHVVGSHRATRTRPITNRNVEFHGRVEDLTEFYDGARIFVAPTRYCAGVPLKIYEAAAHGLPVVATDILASQLGWIPGHDLLVSPVTDSQGFADACTRLYTNSSLWHALREQALARIADECAPARYRDTIKESFEALLRS